ncbi:MAG: hypothetical protein ACKOVH_01235, partial [Actinomycetota bacterium]
MLIQRVNTGRILTPFHRLKVDPGYVYQAFVYTFSSSAVRARSLRIGFTGGFGFTPVNPQVRKLDTRTPGPLSGAIVGGQTKTLALTPQPPANAASALVNLTITDTTGAGFLSLFPAGTAWPSTASINWSASGQTLATSVTVAVSSAGAINIYAGGGGSAQVVVDLLGYYS